MTTFTADQLLDCAREIDTNNWQIIDGEVWCTCWRGKKHMQFTPKKNLHQRFSLARYCADRGASPNRFGAMAETWLRGVGKFDFYHCMGNRVTAFEYVDCMIAAVLALREGVDE